MRPGGRSRLTTALALNVALLVGKAVTGLLAGSLALLADAGHDLTDAGALALALWALTAARRAPTGSKSFGWHRGSVLAAQANAALLVVVVALVAAGAAQRLVHPAAVHGGVVLVAALVAACLNGVAAVLARGVGDALTRRAVLLHLAGDALTSLAVAGSGLLALLTGARWVDPLTSLAVVAVVGVAAYRLLRHTTDVLLEATPAGVDPAAVTATIDRVAGVESAHDLHVWALSAEVHALSVHVVVAGHPSLEQAQAVATAVKHAVAAGYGVAHATVELECEGCADTGPFCAVDPQALDQAALRSH